MSTASGLTMTAAQWADRIRARMGDAVEAIVTTGVDLEAARTQLGKNRYEQMLTTIGMHPKTAQRFIAIARHGVLAARTHVSTLPPSYSTLYTLAAIPENELEAAIRAGSVTPWMERKDAEELRDALKAGAITARSRDTTTHKHETETETPAPSSSGAADGAGVGDTEDREGPEVPADESPSLAPAEPEPARCPNCGEVLS